MTQREVRIILDEKSHTYFVRYVKRQKHQRHLAAQFSSRDNDLETVVRWVRSKPKLLLVDTI